MMTGILATTDATSKWSGCRYSPALWLCALLLLVHTFEAQGRLATTTNSSSSVDRLTNDAIDDSPESLLLAFIDLLNLTDVTCNGFDWCTIHKENVDVYMETTYFYRGGCCASCSCEPTCVAEMNCCPDYTLKPYLDLNGYNYTNISQLLSAIGEIENIEDLELLLPYTGSSGNLPSSPYMNDTDRPPTTCVSSDMNSLSSSIAHRGSMYRMVTTCSKATENVSPEIIRRCEASHEASVEASRAQTCIDDIRPVQSTESGVVYRNVFCMYCGSEANSSYEKWDAYVTDITIPQDLIQARPRSYDDVIAFALRRYTYGMNMIFEPSETFRLRYPPSVCLSVDVGSCNSEVDTHRRLACERFSLPLYIWNGSGKREFVYNNVACLQCNNIGDLLGRSSICSRYNHSPSHLFLGQLQHEHLEYVGSNSSLTERDGILSKVVSTSHCDDGFVYDNGKRSCMQLYCPCGMVANARTCTPIFKTIAGRDVDLFVSVTRRNDDVTSRHTLTDAEYVNVLVDYFDEQFKSDDDDLDISALLVGRPGEPGSSGSSPAQEHAVYVLLEERTFGFDFLAAVRKIDKAARGTKVLMVGENKIEVHMDVVDSIEFRLHKVDVMINPVTRKIYTTLYNRRKKESGTRIVVFTILSCFFYYRIPLSKEDYEVKPSEKTVFIKHLGKYVPLRSLSFLPGGTTLICSNELINQFARSDVDEIGVSLTKNIDFPTAPVRDAFENEYTFLIAVCAVTLVLTLACLAKRACNQWETTADTTGAHELNCANGTHEIGTKSERIDDSQIPD